jgi:hypothetical protein
MTLAFPKLSSKSGLPDKRELQLILPVVDEESTFPFLPISAMTISRHASQISSPVDYGV